MKSRQAILLAVAVVVAALASDAFAHGRGGYRHGGARVGVFIGAPAFAYGYYRPWPAYYPYSYYPYYPPAVVATPPVVVQQSPPVYIERQDEQASAPSASSGGAWYYCPDSKAYYPYVGTCASPWQRVPSQPAPQS